MTYNELIHNLENNIQFSFSRFGDGEMICMWKTNRSCNCDGHKYYPELGRRLLAVLDDPKGVMGLQRLGYSQFKPYIDKYDIKWCDADILHDASIAGEFGKFENALLDRRVILVGPYHLKDFICDVFIEVPKVNAWLKYEEVLEDVNRNVEVDDVVLYSCGMMAEVLIHNMYAEDFTQIDTGSVFDPYFGVRSRKYHYGL